MTIEYTSDHTPKERKTAKYTASPDSITTITLRILLIVSYRNCLLKRVNETDSSIDARKVKEITRSILVMLSVPKNWEANGAKKKQIPNMANLTIAMLQKQVLRSASVRSFFVIIPFVMPTAEL